MKVIEDPNRLYKSWSKPLTHFGIDRGVGMAIIIEILRSRIYKNPIQAVLREYSCNAADEHTKLGLETPFEVSLPTSITPNLKIRDFGPGMSEETVRDVIGNYGASTKRDSNALTGMLGIGSKAGFSYSDSFFITSWFGGEKTIYNCVIDSSNIGQINIMHKEESSEETGVEIDIPVKHSDIDTFQNEAKVIFAYFNPQPKINNAPFTLGDKTYLLSGDGWRIPEIVKSYYGPATNSVAIMGNVGYKIEPGNIKDLEKSILSILNSGIEIDFKIGELEIAASRDGLQYTEYTQKNIIKRVKEIINDVEEKFATIFEKEKNIWDAKLLYRRLKGSQLRNLFDFIKKEWKGIPIEGSVISLGNDKKVQLFRRGRRKSMEKILVSTIECSDENIIVFDDVEKGKSFRRRLYEPLFLGKYRVISVVESEDIPAFLKNNHLEGYDYKLLSSFPKSEISRSDPCEKHIKKVFKFDRTKSYLKQSSQSWEVAEVDMKEGGIYVVIDRFKCSSSNGNMISVRDFSKRLDKIEVLGVDVDEVYGIKIASQEKFKKHSNWISIWDYAREEVCSYIKANNITEAAKNKKELGKANNIIPHNMSRVVDRIANDILGDNSISGDNPLKKFITLGREVRDRDVERKLQNVEEVLSFLKNWDALTGVNSTVEYVSLAERINKEYSLLGAIQYYEVGAHKEAIMDYVRLMDKKYAEKKLDIQAGI